ncbi:dynein-related subfamily AAA family protein [Winogradskyella eximia]|uniref:Dynein-related subfamily AAA family protein n=1 Tax=Winogradskyella eximia TaxID=262006 RepID=A0A3D9GZD4_9FLAO|nr:AAA family ATPase [Winogradskyella eximia]RED42623.1 dynein-related subfamily AAA family protein [Winogradskyella eximia]
MLFDKVKKEHILQGLKDFEEKGYPDGFGPSSTYDVVFEGKTYPPKAIMVYANYHAESRTIERYFKGGIGTDCFNAFQRNGFKIVKKEKTAMNENLYVLKQDFLNTWPIEKLEQMTLEEYTNLDREDSFCYWVEQKTKDLGDVRGGSSYKFGIYRMAETSKTDKASNRTNNGEYAWHNKYGNTQEEAFNTIKSIIIEIAKSAKNNTLEAIDTIDLGNAYKWKIAFLYGNYNCLNAFTIDALRVIASNLDIAYTNKTLISKFHKEIINSKPEDKEYFSWSHELWRQYETRLRDVKKDFAKWLNVNTFESYRAYLGNTNKTIEKKLDEINSFFDDLDFFLVDPNNVNGLVSTILFLLSKKERVKNPDFVEYDSKNSNGIPKAILGKNNYIKFLKEKYDYVEPNYWVFQGSPDIYNLKGALKASHLTSWKVAAHKDKIKIGDKVILWQTGDQSGCYALAEVTSDVKVFAIQENEQQYYKATSSVNATERVEIKIIKNLVNNPILGSEIENELTYINFNAGNQGTNFRATEEEYNTLLNWNEISEGNSFEKTRARLDSTIFDEYITFVRSVIKSLDLKPNDPRVVYSVRGYSLNFIIGQKYCANVYASKNKENFGLISTKKLFKNSEEYAGKSPKTYYNYLEELVLDVNEWRSVIDAIGAVLDKTKKSGYTKSNDLEFENYLFGIESTNKTGNSMIDATNQILYGPPGTGKTYALKQDYFSKYTTRETSITAEKHFETVVKDCSWWEVIAVALLQLGESKVNDIFNHKWVQKKAELSNSNTVKPTLWGQLQSHTIEACQNVNVKSKQQPLIFNKTENSTWEIITEEVDNQIPELYELIEKVEDFKPDANKVIERFKFVTFHQSFSYEDFIEGIKPIMPENGEVAEDLGYKIEDGVFKEICKDASNDPNNSYAIFIDEINRGNVSAIFGELITLIEIDKRKGAKNEMQITLPYSKNIFSVPSNLDIYGTMNTADRSVEALDTALRRRFEFKEMMPDYTVIAEEDVDGILLSEVLKRINERIALLIDRDHTIGHSYFVNVNTTQKLADAFNNKIVPLLQEYFYGDYGKIGLVLGKGFVEKIKNDKIEFASFDYENANDFKTPTYILKPVGSASIIEAIELLLGEADVKGTK